MKTLKQILDTKPTYSSNYYIKDVLEAVKEWLQQKRKEQGQKYIKIPIDELLEELK